MANDILGTRSPNGEVGVRGVADSGELSMLSVGILSGFGITIGSGFNLTVGGTDGVQDVAVAKNSAGESDLLVGNGSAMTFTLPGAPGTSGQSQVHSLVVWKDATVVSAVNDGLDAVGLQVVSGASVTTGSQVAPTEAEIRAAIPNGATAFMATVANVTLNYGDVMPIASRIAMRRSIVGVTQGGTGNAFINPTQVNVLSMIEDGDYGHCTLAAAIKWGFIIQLYATMELTKAWNGLTDVSLANIIDPRLASIMNVGFGGLMVYSGSTIPNTVIGFGGIRRLSLGASDIRLIGATNSLDSGATVAVSGTYIAYNSDPFI